MLILGVLGEYMARGYIESKNRPIYITRNEFCENAESASGKIPADLSAVFDNDRNRTAALSQDLTLVDWEKLRREKMGASMAPRPYSQDTADRRSFTSTDSGQLTGSVPCESMVAQKAD